MKVKSFVVIMLTVLFCSCSESQSNIRTEMSEEEFEQSSNEKNEDALIAIATTFQPTLELTDEIRKSTLEELIMQGKGNYSKIDQKIRESQFKKHKEYIRRKKQQEGLEDVDEDVYAALMLLAPVVSQNDIRMNSPVKIKYVPATSNLAKVYYLEDKGEFIRHNQKYYDRVIDKKIKIQENTEQKNWDKYL